MKKLDSVARLSNQSLESYSKDEGMFSGNKLSCRDLLIKIGTISEISLYNTSVERKHQTNREVLSAIITGSKNRLVNPTSSEKDLK
jgi:hypothetical protein